MLLHNTMPKVRIVAPFVVFMSLVSGCAFTPDEANRGPSIKGSGIAKTETRQVGEFTTLRLQGGIQATIKIGSSPSLQITADDNILPYLEAKNKGQKLTVELGKGSFTTANPITVVITIPDLKRLELAKACTAKVIGDMGRESQVAISEASRLTIDGVFAGTEIGATAACSVTAGNVKSDQLRLISASASTMVVTGSAKKLILEGTGASRFTLMMSADEALVSLGGASTIEGEIQSQNIRQEISGGSKFNAKTPESVRAEREKLEKELEKEKGPAELGKSTAQAPAPPEPPKSPAPSGPAVPPTPGVGP
ncbi:MAG: DUF2807 domain-containing protein [Armatimonadetes bacterium]|nr:DUF2807 domain-containing protein [Armatimonadota bacterium]